MRLYTCIHNSKSVVAVEKTVELIIYAAAIATIGFVGIEIIENTDVRLPKVKEKTIEKTKEKTEDKTIDVPNDSESSTKKYFGADCYEKVWKIVTEPMSGLFKPLSY